MHQMSTFTGGVYTRISDQYVLDGILILQSVFFLKVYYKVFLCTFIDFSSDESRQGEICIEYLYGAECFKV